MRQKPTENAAPPWSAGQETSVRETLERILASPAFRNSKQCQKFLTFAVEHSHAGVEDSLKERTLGVEIFGREPDYDTAADPVVRVRATEVRKRLAQYYAESAVPGDVRFEIPSGSYRVEFHFAGEATPPPAPADAHKPSRHWWPVAAVALVILLAAGVAAWFTRRPAAQGPVEEFWAPVLHSTKPVLIYCGQPVVYFLSREVHDAYRASLPATETRGSYALKLDPNAVVRGKDVIPVTDQFVGIGNAHTAARLSSLFAARSKTVELRFANDVSFSDLRSSPAVLIGAFSNPWTLEITGQARFVFEQDNGQRRIRDRVEKRAWQLTQIAPDGKTPEDYAVVTRLFESETGQVVVAAAGITQYGTRAAGEFLTEGRLLEQALAKAPEGWQKRNLQVVLQTNVYKGTPAAPKVLALHVW